VTWCVYIFEYNERDETSETEWENTVKLVGPVVSEVVGYEGRNRRDGWYDEEFQIKVQQGNRARIKMMSRRATQNTGNYKNK
jgi:hypothetical protein